MKIQIISTKPPQPVNKLTKHKNHDNKIIFHNLIFHQPEKGGFELSDIYSTILKDGCQQDPTEGAPDGNPERGFPSLRLSQKTL